MTPEDIRLACLKLAIERPGGDDPVVTARSYAAFVMGSPAVEYVSGSARPESLTPRPPKGTTVVAFGDGKVWRLISGMWMAFGIDDYTDAAGEPA